MDRSRMSPRQPVGTRLARIVVLALIVGVGVSQLIFTIGAWRLTDAGAYWEAAMRLREGQPLYPALADSEASEVYRYAPWFAWAWVPLTLLPQWLAYVLWSVILLAASAAAVLPLARRRAWTAVAFFLPILVGIAGIGNVQPLIVAALVLGVERRTGPLWIAAGASLKVVPALLVLTYVGRGEWRRALATGVLTVMLVAPMLFYDLSHYPVTAGAAALLPGGPFVYALVVSAGILLSYRLARTRFDWLASATTMSLAVPRFFVYDVTFMMAALPAGGRGDPRAP
jgi:hypothetical protein